MSHHDPPKKKIMSHDDVVIQIKATLDRVEPPPPVTHDCCIYWVPSDMRTLNEDAYTPKVVAIGPLHYYRQDYHPRLQNMEGHKVVYCKAFLERAESSLETFIRYIENVEPNIRRCYPDTGLYFDMQEPEYRVQLILVDSCFILELFWRSYYEEWPEDDPFLLKPWLASNIMLDLMLLENQLPFFVLESLFNLSFSSSSIHGTVRIPSFLELTLGYFSYYNNSNLTSDNISSIRHFTDLIRIFHLQHPLERRLHRKMIYEPMKHLESATELSELGVRFKVNTKSGCSLGLTFSGGVLEIPQLKVDDWTEVLLRNMVAFEQCHYPDESYITDYVAVLDSLINTGRDVDILVQKRILVNWLGDSDSVANILSGLGKNVTHLNFSPNYFALCEKLNDFCRDPLRKLKLKATLRRDYCNTPWRTAASIAGILLLILTVLQSVCSVLQVVHQ